jgi:hypothetical protein
MKSRLHSTFCILHCSFALVATALLAVQPLNAQPSVAPSHAAKASEPIPVEQLGAVAGKQYQGDGLSVAATPAGARLRCVFQRLEGQGTSEGLWLTSTVPDQPQGRFRVVASAMGRLPQLAANAALSELPPGLGVQRLAGNGADAAF